MESGNIDGSYYERALNLVRSIKTSPHQGFCYTKSIYKSLVGRIQGTRHFVHYSGKFVISKA